MRKEAGVSPLAVGRHILGVVALVGVAAGVLAVLTTGSGPRRWSRSPTGHLRVRTAAGPVRQLRVGALKVVVVSCAPNRTDAEVFAAFTLPAAPGLARRLGLGADASNGIRSRVGSYIDPQLATASLTQEYVYPNQAAWQAGERTVVCEVSEANGQLTGSVRAKG